jgi:tetratricopeptide (TPR) repeat protein
MERSGRVVVGFAQPGDAGSAVETPPRPSQYSSVADHRKKQIDWETGLSVSYDRLGNAQAKLDKRDEALAAYRQSLAINERLVTQDASGNIKHNIAVAREKIGDVLASSGDDAQALQQYRESLALREALIAEHPNTSEYRRELAVSYEKLGRLLARSGKVDEALDAFQRSLAIAEQLAARERDNARRQRDLAVAYQEIGDALSGKGRRLEALDLYRKDLAITRQLAQSDPDRMEWQRDLMTSLDRLGSALFDDQPAGDRRAVPGEYPRIAGHDASRVDWQHDEAMMRQLADRLKDQPDEALTISGNLEYENSGTAIDPPDWDGD